MLRTRVPHNLGGLSAQGPAHGHRPIVTKREPGSDCSPQSRYRESFSVNLKNREQSVQPGQRYHLQFLVCLQYASTSCSGFQGCVTVTPTRWAGSSCQCAEALPPFWPLPRSAPGPGGCQRAVAGLSTSSGGGAAAGPLDEIAHDVSQRIALDDGMQQRSIKVHVVVVAASVPANTQHF